MTRKKPAELPPIPCICTNLKMAGRVAGRAYDAALAEAGVTNIQYSILVNVARHQPIGQVQLARHLHMERTTLYRALAILEKQKLVKTQKAEGGKEKQVSLTKAGAELTQKAQRQWQEVQQQFIRRFGKSNLEALNTMLAEVRQHFQA